MQRIVIDGRRIAYREAGQGPPLVLLHGGLVDSRAWRRELDALSDGFRVVAWDAPGCGGSADPPPEVDLGYYADAVAGLVDALELGRAHVVGHSFGGGLALALHDRHPEAVASLVLVSAYAGWAGSLPPEEVDERRRRAEENARRSPQVWVDDFLATLFDETVPRPLVDETREIMLDSRPEGMLPMLNAFADADLRDALPRVTVPTLLLYGEDDRRSPPDVAASLAASIPSARLVLVPGVGHDVHVEAPDVFDREVRSFLDGTA